MSPGPRKIGCSESITFAIDVSGVHREARSLPHRCAGEAAQWSPGLSGARLGPLSGAIGGDVTVIMRADSERSPG